MTQTFREELLRFDLSAVRPRIHGNAIRLFLLITSFWVIIYPNQSLGQSSNAPHKSAWILQEKIRCISYVSPATEDGNRFADGPCPLDSLYWEALLGNRAVRLAKLAQKKYSLIGGF